MKKALLFLAKLSLCMLLVITVEGITTLGSAFDFQHYGPVAWIAQSCVFILALFTASKDWND
jgi:hypothetical protein